MFRKIKLLFTTSFSILVGACANGGLPPADAPFCGVPGASATIEKPSENIPPDLRALLGVWTGIWVETIDGRPTGAGYPTCGTVAVERVYPNKTLDLTYFARTLEKYDSVTVPYKSKLVGDKFAIRGSRGNLYELQIVGNTLTGQAVSPSTGKIYSVTMTKVTSTTASSSR